uniref:Structural protein n=1 Tax=Pseudomonas phage Ulitu01 TaxID=3138550 RepID=A0AAU6W053_9CAUD
MATEVELIDNTAKDGVLDLTGQAGPATNVTAEPDTGATIDNETGKVDEQPELDAEGNPVVKEEPELDAEGNPVVKDETQTEEEAETFYFGDQAVEVTVPDEIAAALTEAGVDQKALLAELFAKEGKFELSEDTRGKLEAKFGKLMVDGYLNMYKGLNDQTIAKHAQEQTSAAEQTAAMQSEYKELVGGEEGLNKLESYILSNFDEKQIGSYNAIMGGDNWEAQKMVIQMARQQMAAHDKQTNGDRSIELLTDGGETAHKGDDDVTVKGYITGAEYQKLMDSDKYWSDRDYQRKVDSMRSQSIRSGR